MPRVGARIVDRIGDRPATIEQAIELVARDLIAPEEDPLAVGPVLVADRGMLVRAMHVDRDAELAQPGDDAARPGERALLHLESGARVGLRGRLFGGVRVEVTSGEVQGGMAHCFDWVRGAAWRGVDGRSPRSVTGGAELLVKVARMVS
ncbi:hypothetical protein BE04_01530 [Sorangium cellulosum]|uniref:Uncharacterized protein n=1 Tax=Sorangium cellulosum TaxID=56 RepID=A0A150P6X3_SORCE|nr:hypothetical protein BE04_01530 [Sorangium cellulosum]